MILGRELASSRILQSPKIFKVVIFYRLCISKILFHKTGHQNARRRRWSVLLNATKLSILMVHFYFLQLVQESDPTEKNTLAKWSELSLIRVDKVVMLSCLTLGMDVVMTSDENKYYDVWKCFFFMSLSMDLILISDRKRGFCLVL